MDNPEYILRSSTSGGSGSTRGDYHTLGIPFSGSANNGSPASSQGPSSIHSVHSNPPSANGLGQPLPPQHPTQSLSSNGSSGTTAVTTIAGLNGVINQRPVSTAHGVGVSGHFAPGSATNSEGSDGHHGYYNDFTTRLQLQPPPVRQPKTTGTVWTDC